jgi:hypothetical protein
MLPFIDASAQLSYIAFMRLVKQVNPHSIFRIWYLYHVPSTETHLLSSITIHSNYQIKSSKTSFYFLGLLPQAKRNWIQTCQRKAKVWPHLLATRSWSSPNLNWALAHWRCGAKPASAYIIGRMSLPSYPKDMMTIMKITSSSFPFRSIREVLFCCVHSECYRPPLLENRNIGDDFAASSIEMINHRKVYHESDPLVAQELEESWWRMGMSGEVDGSLLYEAGISRRYFTSLPIIANHGG